MCRRLRLSLQMILLTSLCFATSTGVIPQLSQLNKCNVSTTPKVGMILIPPICAEDVADNVIYVATRPAHVQVPL